MSDVPPTDVLIAGAGPTGLALAIWLTRLGVRVQIIAASAGPGTASRALVVHARTLELYQPLGLAEPAVAAGTVAAAMNLWAGGRRRAHVTLGAAGAGLSPYPYFLVFPQEQHEQLLVRRLQDLGVAVRWGCELLDFTDHGTHVTARLRDSNGLQSGCEASYLVGCDGAHSGVRAGLGLDYSGGTYPQTFYVADIEGHGLPVNGEGHVLVSRGDFLLILPMGGQRARLVGMAAGTEGAAEAATFESLSRRAMQEMQLRVDKIRWFSSYRIHHRVAAAFRRGRVFLAGDAAHIHSPVGGQGMNTGIGDAINLAWKLAAVLHAQAGEALLDTYEAERMPFARLLVKTTDRAFTLATARSPLADFIRARLVPRVMSLAGSVAGGSLRREAFRMVSQIRIRYRQGPLSQGRAGRVCGGDRLPWVSTAHNFSSLDSLTWQVHVYGTAHERLSAGLAARAIALHVFPWSREAAAAGLRRDALYLVRPDGYVALADAKASLDTLERYLNSRGMRCENAPRSDAPAAGDVLRRVAASDGAP